MKTLLLTLVALWSPVGVAAQAKPVKLLLNWHAEPEFGGFYAAELTGAFKEAGLDVKIIEGGSGAPVAQTVSAGQIEFGVSNADEVIISRSRGADIIALFAVNQTNPQGIMVHAERGFKKLEDVFTHPGTLAAIRGMPYFIWLEKKFGPGQVKVVPYRGGVGEFLRDKNFSQQCFVSSEPIVARRGGADPQTFLAADSGYNPYNTVLVTRASYLAKNPEIVRKMVHAVRAGWQSYLKDPMPANKAMHAVNKTMDEETFAQIAELQKKLILTPEATKRGIGSMTAARWKTLGEQLHELKIIDKVPSADECFRMIGD